MIAAQIVTAWHCLACDVMGRSAEDETRCWYCGATDVVVTARPYVAFPPGLMARPRVSEPVQ